MTFDILHEENINVNETLFMVYIMAVFLLDIIKL